MVYGSGWNSTNLENPAAFEKSAKSHFLIHFDKTQISENKIPAIKKASLQFQSELDQKVHIFKGGQAADQNFLSVFTERTKSSFRAIRMKKSVFSEWSILHEVGKFEFAGCLRRKLTRFFKTSSWEQAQIFYTMWNSS